MLLSDFLKTTRISMRITQREFARRLGVPISTYTGWEHGKVLPTFQGYEKLLDYMTKHNIGVSEMEKIYETEKALKLKSN